MKILVVDDEEDLCEILKFNLETEGYEVDTAFSSEEALGLRLTDYDLLLLDVMMGEVSGYKLASQLKKNPKTAHIPIIFLTAKDTENDMLTGFNIGADDFISKPYSLKEVSARIRAVLRRSQKKQESSSLSFETLRIDSTLVKAYINDDEIALSKKEFEILKLLVEHLDTVLSREKILSKVWSDEVYVIDRTIDVNITRLRKKIGPYGKHIVTRLGYGYCFESQPERHQKTINN